jgi:hypothetical protein
MAFDVPRRIEAKTYEVGDLISLSGLAGEESFDYPYLYVTEKYTASYNSGVWFYPQGEIIYPAWSEAISYTWQDYRKSNIELQLSNNNSYYYNWSGQQWKVWHNGILYEATDWTFPNVGTPPNEQYTNFGDKAGRQINLKNEQGIGYASILTNQSHRFRSWKIADEQPNNPDWIKSPTLSYLIFNNDLGDDTLGTGGSLNYSSDDPENSHDFDPIINLSLPNRYHWLSSEYGANVGGWYIKAGVPDTSHWQNEIRSLESYYSDEPSTKVYQGFSTFGWNYWTGRMPTLDSIQTNPYNPNSYGGSEVGTGVSVNLWSQAYQETRRLQNEPQAYEIVNAYPNPDKIFITALQDFNWDYRIGDEVEPIKDREGDIDRSGRIIIRDCWSRAAEIINFPVSGLPVTDPNDVSISYNLFYGATHPLFWGSPVKILVGVGELFTSRYWYTGDGFNPSSPNADFHSSRNETNSGEKWIDLSAPNSENISRHPSLSYITSVPSYSIGTYTYTHKATVGNPNSSYKLNTGIRFVYLTM